MKCIECEYCYRYQTRGAYRYNFRCDHPDQKYIQDWFARKRMVKMPGFIGFGKSIACNELQIKTSPAWCPLKRKD